MNDKIFIEINIISPSDNSWEILNYHRHIASSVRNDTSDNFAEDVQKIANSIINNYKKMNIKIKDNQVKRRRTT